MAEYIEREAAIKFVKEQMAETNNKTSIIGSCVTQTYDMAIRHAVALLRRVPTAYPKAEVVRCKNCKNYELMKSGNYHFCNEFGGYVTEKDFCSRAQKMDGGENDA